MLTAFRTHDYGKQPIDKLPGLIRQEGGEAAQLILPKAFTEINSYEEVTLSHLEQIRRSFEKEQVPITILGCYMDLGNPDREVREYAVKTFRQCLGFAKELGAYMVGTETAYPHLHPEERRQWRPYMEDSIARLLDEAEKLDALMALEPVYWHPLTNLETVLQILDKFKSDHLRLIFDPANVLEFPETTAQPSFWREWLEAVGHKVDALHMKDFRRDKEGQYMPRQLGDGIMDYTEIFRWLKKNRPDIVIVREELVPETAQQDILYMKNLWDSTAV